MPAQSRTGPKWSNIGNQIDPGLLKYYCDNVKDLSIWLCDLTNFVKQMQHAYDNSQIEHLREENEEADEKEGHFLKRICKCIWEIVYRIGNGMSSTKDKKSP